MKQFKLTLIILFVVGKLFAQPSNDATIPTYKIGIFAPLYLDSIFNNGTLKYKDGVPKFVQPSLEFVQGVQIALDSLKIKTANIKAYIYDSKSYTKGIYSLVKTNKLDSLNLIIGHSRDLDFKQLSDFALAKNIPFISVTYPNDGGITSNPFTVIMNSTLKAHCESIYGYLLQNNPTDKLFLLRKKGTQEDKIASYFKAINEQDGKPLLNIQTINVDSNFNSDVLVKSLDSNRKTVIIGASLDETFANNVANSCNDLYAEGYPITLIGMPNWDGFSSLRKKDAFEEFPIYFTTPYYNTKWDEHSKQLISAYAKKYKTKPSDMAYKGFEAAWMFTKLLIAHPTDFMSNLNDKSAKVFCEYNFKPVTFSKTPSTPDYFENKHVYFIKLLNGAVSKAW